MCGLQIFGESGGFLSVFSVNTFFRAEHQLVFVSSRRSRKNLFGRMNRRYGVKVHNTFLWIDPFTHDG